MSHNVDLEDIARALGGPPGTAYEPRRDHRFEYASDAIWNVEETTCSRGAGCVHAGRRSDVREHGPGGTCDLLAGIFLEDTQPQIRDLGDQGLTCTRYRERTVKRRDARLDAASHSVPSLFEAAR